MRVPAQTIGEAYAACPPDIPLEFGDRRWVDFSSVYGVSPEGALLRHLRFSTGEARTHLALAGHRGCGKSTALLRLVRLAEKEGYLAVYLVTNEEIHPYEVEYPDLLLLISKALESRLREMGLELDKNLQESIANWYKDVTEWSEEMVERSLGIRAEAGVGAELPFFARLMVGLTSLFRTESKERREVREKIRNYPKALIENTNLLLDDALGKVKRPGRRAILFVFDNIDRYPPGTIDSLLIGTGDLLKSLHCNLVYTVPVQLVHKPVTVSLSDVMAVERFLMVKVKDRKTGRKFRPGVDKLREVLLNRVSKDLFQDKGLIEEIVLTSGGCLRDLMHLVQQSCLAAEGEQIDREALRAALMKIRSDLSSRIPEDFYHLMAKVHPRKDIVNDEDHRTMLYYRYVLEYDGERWADVHPFILGMEKFQNALKKEKQKKRR